MEDTAKGPFPIKPGGDFQEELSNSCLKNIRLPIIIRNSEQFTYFHPSASTFCCRGWNRKVRTKKNVQETEMQVERRSGRGGRLSVLERKIPKQTVTKKGQPSSQLTVQLMESGSGMIDSLCP